MSGPIPHRQRIALRALTSILFVGVMLHLLIKPPLITTYDSIGSDTNSDISRKISTSSNKKQECHPHPQPQYQILMCLPTLEDATTTLNNNKNENYNDCQPHVIFTTFVCSDKPCSPLRTLIERNTYHIWSSFPRATFLSISASSVRTNIYGIPVLGDMFHYSMTKCPNATSFTYINGDLLATTSFIDTIDSIVNIMGDGEFLSKYSSLFWFSCVFSIYIIIQIKHAVVICLLSINYKQWWGNVQTSIGRTPPRMLPLPSTLISRHIFKVENSFIPWLWTILQPQRMQLNGMSYVSREQLSLCFFFGHVQNLTYTNSP